MTNGNDPAVLTVGGHTLCLLVPDELGEAIGPDEVARLTVAQLYGPRGWQLMTIDDPRYVEMVDQAIEDDPTLQLVTRRTGVVYARAGVGEDAKKLVRHIRVVVIEGDKPTALAPLVKKGVQVSRSEDAPSPSRLATGFEATGKVTRATARPSTKKKTSRGKR